MAAEHVAGMERIRADGRAAVPAGGAQMMQTFQIAALAFPVANRIIDELEIADAAKIRDRKNRAEDRLQAHVFTFIRQQVHLQKAFI